MRLQEDGSGLDREQCSEDLVVWCERLLVRRVPRLEDSEDASWVARLELVHDRDAQHLPRLRPCDRVGRAIEPRVVVRPMGVAERVLASCEPDDAFVERELPVHVATLGILGDQLSSRMVDLKECCVLAVEQLAHAREEAVEYARTHRDSVSCLSHSHCTIPSEAVYSHYTHSLSTDGRCVELTTQRQLWSHFLSTAERVMAFVMLNCESTFSSTLRMFGSMYW